MPRHSLLWPCIRECSTSAAAAIEVVIWACRSQALAFLTKYSFRSKRLAGLPTQHSTCLLRHEKATSMQQPGIDERESRNCFSRNALHLAELLAHFPALGSCISQLRDLQTCLLDNPRPFRFHLFCPICAEACTSYFRTARMK